MKPLGFQFIVVGWARPSLLVQRTMTDSGPAGGAISVCHWRKLYLPSSWPSVVGRQLVPPSIEMSTAFTPVEPPKAMPRTGVLARRP